MQELLGRLTALDPEASETLKVVTYFDALVRAGAGADALVRAAATLSGTTAGATLGARTIRRDAGGRRVEGEPPTGIHPARSIPTGAVWLERIGDPHANDEMVVERLALAMELRETRGRTAGSIEVAIDADRPLADRAAALARLHLHTASRVRAIAVPWESTAAGSTPVVTAAGLVRVVIDDGTFTAPGRAGLGAWGRAEELPASWRSAAAALRLTDARHPVVDATELGALLLVADLHDSALTPPDVRVLAALDIRTREVLAALVDAESLRAAAAVLGMHHSTVQARHEALTRELGYDPRSPVGRARYVVAELLLRLESTG